MNWFKKMIGQPDWTSLAVKELEEAKVSLLESETALDWARSNVEYNLSRIERLEHLLKIKTQND
jgi:hypothetical protein